MKYNFWPFLKKYSAFIIICAIFLTFLLTMLPSQAYFDYGEFQTLVSVLDIAHPTGYPTYILVGFVFVHLFPFGEIAWRANLLSVLYTTGALVFCYLFLANLTKAYFWPIIGVLTMAFVRPVWDHSGMADEHPLNLFFMFFMFYLFLRLSIKWSLKKWFLFCLSFGLGLGNHMLLLFIIPGLFIWFIGLLLQKKFTISARLIFYGSAGFLLGFSVYLFLPLRQLFGPSVISDNLLSIKGFIGYITGESFQNQMLQGGLSTIVKNMWDGLLIITRYFPVWGLTVAIFGLISGLFSFTLVTIVLITSFALSILFTTNFPTGDPTRYYLEDLSYVAVFIGLGVVSIASDMKNLGNSLKLNKISRQLIYTITFIAFFILPMQLFFKNYQLVDKSKNYEAAEYSKRVLNQLLPNSVIITWWSYYTPMWYRQSVLHERQDVLILIKSQSEWKYYVDQYLNSRPVYIIENEKEVASSYRLEQQGSVYLVKPN